MSDWAGALDVLQRRSIDSDGPENAPKYAFPDPKMKKYGDCPFLTLPNGT